MKNLIISAACMLIILTGNAFAEGGDPDKGKEKSASCAACHGADGNSPVPTWPKLAGQNAQYLEKQLNDYLTGNRKNDQMSPMAAVLTNEDIPHVAAYYSNQMIKPGVARQDMVEMGEMLYRAGDSKTGVAACMGCHGPKGTGNTAAGYPSLQGQHAAYTKAQLIAFKSGDRSNDANSAMRIAALRMTDEQIEAVSEYIQGLH
jgi:cytochrome c553